MCPKTVSEAQFCTTHVLAFRLVSPPPASSCAMSTVPSPVATFVLVTKKQSLGKTDSVQSACGTRMMYQNASKMAGGDELA